MWLSALLTPGNLLSLIVVVSGTLGGVYVFKRSASRQLTEIQAKMVEAAQALNETYEKDIQHLRGEIVRLKEENTIMRKAFERLGMEIEFNNGSITLFDIQQATRKRIMQIHTDQSA